MDLLNKLLLVFCLRYFYYYCCCFYYNYYWFASRLLDTIIRKQLFSNVLNFIFLVNIDLTVKFFKCLTLHCYVFAGYNYEACAGRFKNISVEKSELSFCVYSITLWFCVIFFIRKKLFEGSLRVDLPILLWFVFVLVDSLELNFIFIYIPYRCKSKAYSASHIIVYFAINNSLGCRGKNKLIIIVS